MFHDTFFAAWAFLFIWILTSGYYAIVFYRLMLMLQLLTYDRQRCYFQSAAEYAVMPDTYEAFRQNVQSKSSDELRGFQRHLFFCISVPVIFVSKGYRLVAYLTEAMIADGYFVCISAQVFYYLQWTTKGTFGRQCTPLPGVKLQLLNSSRSMSFI